MEKHQQKLPNTLQIKSLKLSSPATFHLCPTVELMDVHRYADGTDRIEKFFTVLSNSRRRIIVRMLADNHSIPLRTIAETVTLIEGEYDQTDPEIPPQDRRSVYVSLYQSHAHPLADADIIDYNESKKIIQLGTCHGVALRFLNCCETATEPNRSNR